MKNLAKYRVGEIVFKGGCFTLEYFIRGLTCDEIGKELGLPPRVMANGASIAMAIELPSYNGFKPAGWTRFSTDNISHRKNGKMVWDEATYLEFYTGKRLPIPIREIQKSWLSDMKKEKLVKVLPNIDYEDNEYFPRGGKAGQIVVTNPLRCEVTNQLTLNDRFKGIWR